MMYSSISYSSDPSSVSKIGRLGNPRNAATVTSPPNIRLGAEEKPTLGGVEWGRLCERVQLLVTPRSTLSHYMHSGTKNTHSPRGIAGPMYPMQSLSSPWETLPHPGQYSPSAPECRLSSPSPLAPQSEVFALCLWCRCENGEVSLVCSGKKQE